MDSAELQESNMGGTVVFESESAGGTLAVSNGEPLHQQSLYSPP
jgi:hypothetical protein